MLHTMDYLILAVFYGLIIAIESSFKNVIFFIGMNRYFWITILKQKTLLLNFLRNCNVGTYLLDMFAGCSLR